MSQAFHKDFSASAGAPRGRRPGRRRKKTRQSGAGFTLPKTWIVGAAVILAIAASVIVGGNSRVVSAKASIPH